MTWPAALGRYEIQEEIGRGGVGVVHRAVDTDLGRDVAVKLLHERHQQSGELLQRFVEEAQVEGQLEHPGIVPVYELGLTAARQPFFAMKLVTGESFARLLARRESVEESRAEILGVFLQVCQAVAYAHARGVIHRDLKPGNVMIGAFGEVHVVDWGFAKVLRDPEASEGCEASTARPERSRTPTSASDLSRAGAVLGTPAYMPPEQARGRIDELDRRTDVFALGAVLCEILTGSPPYGDGEEDSLAEAAAGDVTPALERLEAAGADPDLNALCGACLAPLPQERPEHAGVVAERLEAHLTAAEARAHRSRLEAVEQRAAADRAQARAEAAEAAARAQRRRRRQVLALAGAVVAAVAVLAGGWTWWQWDRAARARRTTDVVHAALEETARLQSRSELEPALAAAERAVDLAASDAAPAELRARAETARARIAAALEAAQATETRARRDARLLERLRELRLSLYDEDAEALARTDADFARAFDEAGLRLAPLNEAAAEVARRRGSDVIAATLVEWATRRIRRGAGDEPRPRDLLQVAASAASSPNPRVQAALLDGSEGELVAASREPDLPARDLERLALLLLAHGNDEAAAAALRLGHDAHPADPWLAVHLGRVALALDPPVPDEAVDVYVVATTLWPSSACLRYQLARAHLARDDDEAALVALRRSVTLEPRHSVHDLALGHVLTDKDYPEDARRRFETAVRLDPTRAGSWHLLGRSHQRLGDTAAAVEAHREAVRLGTEKALHHRGLGDALAQSGDAEGALPAYRRAIELDAADTLAMNNLGAAALANGDPATAISVLEGALDAAPSLRAARYNLAVARHRDGDLPGAIADMRRYFERQRLWRSEHSFWGALLVDEKTFDGAKAIFQAALAETPDSLEAHFDLAEAYLAGRADAAALEVFDRVVALQPGLARGHRERGRVLGRMRRHEDALQAARRAVELDSTDADALCSVANDLRNLRRFRESVRTFQQALGLDPQSAEAHGLLAATLGTTRRFEEAAEHARRATELEPNMTMWHNIYGSVLVNGHLGRDGEAARAFRRAIALNPGSWMLHMNLGNALSEGHELRRAAEEYRRALELERGRPMIYVNVGGMLCDDFADYEGAIRVFREGLAVAPKHNILLGNLAVALKFAGQRDEALKTFRQAIDVNPEYAQSRFQIAVLLWERPEGMEEAVHQLREAVRIAPRNEAIRLHYAQALAASGAWDEALATLRDAVKLRPRNMDLRLNVAWYGIHRPDATRDDYEDARDVVDQCMELADGIVVRRTLGAVLYRLERYEPALRNLEMASSEHLEGGGFNLLAYLALAHAKLGHEREARFWYENALETYAERKPETGPGAIQERLLAEAKALLDDRS